MTSRLYRSVPASIPRPLFTVTSGPRTFTDATIRAITITHGKNNPEGGLHPATCEVEVSGAVGILHDRNVSVRLSDHAAAVLGGTTATAARFTGRVATQQVITHPRRGRGPRHTSTLRCSSWSAVALGAQRAPLVSGGATMAGALANMFARAEQWTGAPLPLTISSGWGDWFHGIDNGLTGTFSELIGAIYADTGHLLRQLRHGTVQAMTLQARADAGEAAAADWWPITLGHAVSEVEHEQPTDLNNVGIELIWREAPNPADPLTNQTVRRKWAWRGSDDGVPATDVAEWREYDWTHMVSLTEQYRHAINAVASRAFRVAFSTPRIRVDLLALARSTRPYDRTMLQQLLQLHQGDPVVFGGDWSAQWNGIYYAEQITETITPDEWSLDLALYPPQEVTGHYGRGGAPTPPARSWGQHTRPWPTGTNEWS